MKRCVLGGLANLLLSFSLLIVIRFALVISWRFLPFPGGGIAALLYTSITSRGTMVIPHEIANGMLGALVAITATCASVHTYAALIIGFLGSLSALAANELILRWELDDPVGAVGVHGASAIWGLAAVGLFADSELPGIQVKWGLGMSRFCWKLFVCTVISKFLWCSFCDSWFNFFLQPIGWVFPASFRLFSMTGESWLMVRVSQLSMWCEPTSYMRCSRIENGDNADEHDGWCLILLATTRIPNSKEHFFQVANGLFRGGSARLLGVQMLLALSIIAWSLVTMVPFFYIVGLAFGRRQHCCDFRSGLRVDPQEELMGLDHVMHSSAPNTRKSTICSVMSTELEDSVGSCETGNTKLGLWEAWSTHVARALRCLKKHFGDLQPMTVIGSTAARSEMSCLSKQSLVWKRAW